MALCARILLQQCWILLFCLRNNFPLLPGENTGSPMMRPDPILRKIGATSGQGPACLAAGWSGCWSLLHLSGPIFIVLTCLAFQRHPFRTCLVVVWLLPELSWGSVALSHSNVITLISWYLCLPLVLAFRCQGQNECLIVSPDTDSLAPCNNSLLLPTSHCKAVIPVWGWSEWSSSFPSLVLILLSPFCTMLLQHFLGELSLWNVFMPSQDKREMFRGEIDPL